MARNSAIARAAAVDGLVIRDGDDSSLLIGGTGNDKIMAGGGNDTIFGGPGQDTIYGGDGDDLILAAGGGGVFSGGDGNDYMQVILKNGNNHMTGGSGADVFHFHFSDSVQYSHTVVADFEIGVDAFVFTNSDGSTTGIASMVQTGAGVRVTTVYGDTVDFRNLQLADVQDWLDSGQMSTADMLLQDGHWGI